MTPRPQDDRPNAIRHATYPTLPQLALAIAAERPVPDTSLEQFHMTADSLIRQAEKLQEIFSGKTVLFLGDDDHVSVLLAAFSDVTPVVYDIDVRVIDSLNTWAERLPLLRYSARVHDIRDPLPESRLCDAFYINPPYASHNAGYSIRFWLTRALEGCIPNCDGVLVLPTDDTLRWVNDNWFSVQEFLGANGCRIINRDRLTHLYEQTNDLGLRSENLYLRRYDSSKSRKEDPRPGPDLYR